MVATLTQYGIDRLTPAERLELISAIWDSIPDTAEEITLPEWQQELLKARIAAADADPGRGSSWDEVKARLRAQP